MKKTCLVLLAGMSPWLNAAAQTAPSPLIIVEDRGGMSALPYYQALTPQDAPSWPAPELAPRMDSLADAETAMLPVRSVQLSPGDEPRRVIHVPGLTPLFLVGDDERSRTWLKQQREKLRGVNAVGLVVSVETAEALAALRRLAPDLTLSPVSADDLAQRLDIRHYPVLITATGVEP